MPLTEITTDLLHSYGFKSILDDYEPDFFFGTYALQYDPINNVWGCQGFNDTFQYWEDFLAFYKKHENKDFVPEAPTPIVQQFILDID